MLPPELSYREVGATAGTLPPGYRHIRRSAVLGSGGEVFERAADELMSWHMHRKAGLTVEAERVRAELGSEVRLGWSIGPIRVLAPCRVVRVVADVTAIGFAYGTLIGYPESGEESFVVVH